MLRPVGGPPCGCPLLPETCASRGKVRQTPSLAPAVSRVPLAFSESLPQPLMLSGCLKDKECRSPPPRSLPASYSSLSKAGSGLSCPSEGKGPSRGGKMGVRRPNQAKSDQRGGDKVTATLRAAMFRAEHGFVPKVIGRKVVPFAGVNVPCGTAFLANRRPRAVLLGVRFRPAVFRAERRMQAGGPECGAFTGIPPCGGRLGLRP